ncbi:hypothetical protein PENSPDRAFT_680645 [Peniophora sp. CONT]|nr:hypothetical protein PENSPDRAFT_680645 [Peniophora sp. CONT]
MPVTTRTGTNKRAASISPPSSPSSTQTPKKKLFIEASDDEYEEDGFVVFGGSDEGGAGSTDSSGGKALGGGEDSSSLTSPSDDENAGDATSDVKTDKGKGKGPTSRPVEQAAVNPAGNVDLDSLDEDPFISTHTARLRRGNNANKKGKGGDTVSGGGKENSRVGVVGSSAASGQHGIAAGAVTGGAPGHNTVVDVNGIPIPTTRVEATPVIYAGDMRSVGHDFGTPAFIPANVGGTPVAVSPAVNNVQEVAHSSTPSPATGNVPADPVSGSADNGAADSAPASSAPAAAEGDTVLPPPPATSTVLAPVFVRPDGGEFTNQMKARLRGFSLYAKPADSVYYIGRQPKQVEWSSGKVKDSCLVHRGQVSRLVHWVIGALSWNGMLPNADGNFPTKPKVSVKPLRNEDLMLFRKIIQDKSCSSKPVDTSNVGSISAHTDMSVRTRGADAARASMFPRLYDAQQKFTADKQGMRQLRPADFLRDDIVLLEVSVGRYWDETANGRVLNWNSNRVYFRLESMSLIQPGNEEIDEDVLEFEAGNHTMAEFI